MAENLRYTDKNVRPLSDYEFAHWQDFSNCGPETAELFFASKNDTKKIEAAKRLCAACRIAEICLGVAMQDKEKFGIWGGKTEEERGHKPTKWNDDSSKIPEEESPIEEVVLPTMDDIVGSPFTIDNKEYELLTEEQMWQRMYKKLGSHATATAIGHLFGRGPAWVNQQALYLHVESEPMIVLSRERQVYSAELALRLHEIPSSNGWLTIRALAREVGSNKDWVKRRLNEFHITPEDRMSETGGKMRPHYPRLCIDLLKAVLENREVEAGDWLTVSMMATMLDLNYDWVLARVEANYAEFAELRRIPKIGKVVPHYPPFVLEELRVKAEEFKQYPIATKQDISINGLVEVLDHTDRWIKARLPYVNYTSTLKIEPYLNRLFQFFPYEIANALSALPENILEYSPVIWNNLNADNEGN